MKIRIGLIKEEEVAAFLQTIAEKEEFSLSSSFAFSIVELQGDRQQSLSEMLKNRFSTFFLGEKRVEEALNDLLLEKRVKLSFAESCTGGLLGASLVAVPGASFYFQGSIVAYSNPWKERFLHVRRDTLRRFGAVSSQTVQEMVEGLLIESDSDYALAVTGFLGPFEEEKKAEVFIGLARRGEEVEVGKIEVPSERKEGMQAVVEMALFFLFRKVMHQVRTFG